MTEENVNTVRVLRGPNITYLYILYTADLHKIMSKHLSSNYV